MKAILGWTSLIVSGAILFASNLQARADKIDIDQLPKSVIEGVHAKFPKAKFVRASFSKADGKTTYEVTLSLKGYSYDVSVSDAGKIIQVEKEIKASELPKAVKAAVDGKYPSSTIKKAEEVTKGEVVTYEVLLLTAQKKTLEVYLNPMGKILEEKTVAEPKKDSKDSKKGDK